MTMQLIETKTLGTAAASITFTSIPQDGTDLVLMGLVRTARANANDFVDLRFNGDNTDSNYSSRVLYGNGSSANSFTENSYIGDVNGATSTADTFSSINVYLPNYAGSTTKLGSVENVMENNAALAPQSIVSRLWNNTAAITSMEIGFTVAGSNLVVGSTFSLYKITKGSDGIVTTSTT
jgi:hypothetical protein